VRYIGYSNFSAWQSAKFLGIQQQHNYSPFVAAQMYYSLVGRDIENEIVPFCTDVGVGIVVWSPLAGGFLSGRYTRKDPTGGKGRLATFDFLPFDKEKGYDLVDQLQKIGEQHGSSVAQVALAWMISKPFVTSILLGASKLSQLEDNLGALNLLLPHAELEIIEKLTLPAPIYPAWFQTATADPVTTQALAQGITDKAKAA
jgi:aryl-alcohol dehydrogenase-like predicted oxidoreductase